GGVPGAGLAQGRGGGLNLTAADHVFLFDPWWNSAIELQAIDRVHWIGHGRPVTAHRLVAENAMETKIRASLASRCPWEQRLTPQRSDPPCPFESMASKAARKRRRLEEERQRLASLEAHGIVHTRCSDVTLAELDVLLAQVDEILGRVGTHAGRA